MIEQREWLVATHGVAAAAGVAAWCRSPSERRTDRLVWLLAVLAVSALGVDRFEGWSGDAADRVRSLARRRSWYGGRRNFQIALSTMSVVMTASVLVALVGARSRVRPSTMTAALCAVVLAALRLVASISLHDVDSVLRAQWGGVQLRVAAEAGLLAAIVVSAGIGSVPDRVVRL